MDTLKIRDRIGYREIVSVKKGLEKTIKWELESKYKEDINKRLDYKKEDSILKKLIKIRK